MEKKTILEALAGVAVIGILAWVIIWFLKRD